MSISMRKSKCFRPRTVVAFSTSRVVGTVVSASLPHRSRFPLKHAQSLLVQPPPTVFACHKAREEMGMCICISGLVDTIYLNLYLRTFLSVQHFSVYLYKYTYMIKKIIGPRCLGTRSLCRSRLIEAGFIEDCGKCGCIMSPPSPLSRERGISLEGVGSGGRGGVGG